MGCNDSYDTICKPSICDCQYKLSDLEIETTIHNLYVGGEYKVKGSIKNLIEFARAIEAKVRGEK